MEGVLVMSDEFCEYCAGEKTVDCSWCSGSGEGMADGSRCMACHGKGYHPCPECVYTPDPADYLYED